jgi:ABC-type sugar transport system ATPase subunit
VGIIGKSGSGKSTLINMITGIDRSTCGEVWVGDTAVHTRILFGIKPTAKDHAATYRTTSLFGVQV